MKVYILEYDDTSSYDEIAHIVNKYEECDIEKFYCDYKKVMKSIRYENVKIYVGKLGELQQYDIYKCVICGKCIKIENAYDVYHTTYSVEAISVCPKCHVSIMKNISEL